VPKSAERLFHEFRSNSDADVAMSLLRSANALLYLSLMAAHLGEGQIVDGMSLAASIEEDLADIRRTATSEDFDDPGPDAADGMLRHWTRKGWLYCSINADTRTERYQLTSGAEQAVRQMVNLQRHTSTATESALSMVMAEIRQIATAANPDPAVRKKALTAQIDALKQQLAKIKRGEVAEVNAAELIDKVAALAQLMERIPSDVARYGELMQANTALLLRQSLAEDAAQFADSLARMFHGHDVISDSPEGRAFRAFANLVGVPSQRDGLEEDIGEILERVEGLPGHLAEVLGGFTDAMWQRVCEVETVRGLAFRRMSNFVRGGDALHYRSMRSRVGAAQLSAAEAFAVTYPGRSTGFAIPMGAALCASVGRLRLDEGTATAVDSLAEDGDEFEIDPAALAGRESIDWLALFEAVNTAVEAHGGYATVPEVLGRLAGPRVGDVIGIWSLATRHGEVSDEKVELVHAHTDRGLREVTLPYAVFSGRLPDPVAPGPGRARRSLGAGKPVAEGLFDV
jgi:hypothetical protein